MRNRLHRILQRSWPIILVLSTLIFIKMASRVITLTISIALVAHSGSITDNAIHLFDQHWSEVYCILSSISLALIWGFLRNQIPAAVRPKSSWREQWHNAQWGPVLWACLVPPMLWWLTNIWIHESITETQMAIAPQSVQESGDVWFRWMGIFGFSTTLVLSREIIRWSTPIYKSIDTWRPANATAPWLLSCALFLFISQEHWETASLLAVLGWVLIKTPDKKHHISTWGHHAVGLSGFLICLHFLGGIPLLSSPAPWTRWETAHPNPLSPLWMSAGWLAVLIRPRRNSSTNKSQGFAASSLNT